MNNLNQNDNGKLDAIAFPGGYSIRYMCEDSDVICADCANEWLASDDSWYGQAPVHAFIDWEGEGHECANCNEHLPSEYGPVEES